MKLQPNSTVPKLLTFSKPNHTAIKKALLMLSIFAVFSCMNAQKTQFSKEALEEKLESIDGKSLAFGEILKNHEGKTILIEVWASWCGDCVKSMPKFKEVQSANPDAVYIFISMDKSVDKWKEGITKHDLVGNHYFSADGMKGKFGQTIDLDWIPRYIIVDKTGKVVTYRAVETDFEQINSTLKSLK